MRATDLGECSCDDRGIERVVGNILRMIDDDMLQHALCELALDER